MRTPGPWLALPLAFAICALAQARPGAGAPGPGWRDGPVRYLLTRAEYDRYGRLETDEAREAFVTRFWHRRDTDPATPENEFRTRFEARCAAANGRFQEGVGPGWRTDRGRILVLLGEPDTVRRDAGETRGRDREIWTYLNPPGGTGIPLEIYFYRGTGGAFTLRPESLRGIPLELAERLGRETDLRRKFSDDFPGLNAYDLDRLVEFSLDASEGEDSPEREAERQARRRAAAGGSRRREELTPAEAPAFDQAAYFFQSADRSVLVLLAISLPEATAGDDAGDVPTSPTSVLAWFREADAPPEARAPPEVPLERSEPSGDAAVFVGKAYLEPGRYGVRVAVADDRSQRMAVRSFALEVPELGSGRLSASSVVPAERFGEVPPDQESPYAVGSEAVIPRPGGEFRLGEPLRLYLQVYDAALDPGTATARLDVRFRFERATRRGFRAHRAPLLFRGAEGASIGLALPVGDWPVGEYRVAVQIDDRISGATTSSEGRFRLVP